MLVQPHIQKVEKIAIVSIYMNSHFYDIKAQKGSKSGNILKALTKNTLKIKDMYSAEQQQIISHALEEYSKKLNMIDKWAVLSPAEILQNEKYHAFFKSKEDKKVLRGILKTIKRAEQDEWAVPEKMQFIPISSVIETGATRTRDNNKNSPEEVRKALGKLCSELQVDAVAIIGLDVGYATGMKFGAGLPVNKTKIKPSIKANMVVINEDGNIAVKTPAAGARYNSKGVMLTMLNGSPVLKHKKGKAVSAFNAATENSAVGLREKIQKAYSKLK
jgi:hypothetical protein